jgi:hypothetical protein
MTNKIYSLDGQLFHSDWLRMVSYTDELKVGDTYWEADQVPETHDDYITSSFIDSILENLDESLSWNHGDYFDICYLDVTSEQNEELRQLILDWAKKNIELNVYRIVNPIQKVITQEDFQYVGTN